MHYCTYNTYVHICLYIHKEYVQVLTGLAVNPLLKQGQYLGHISFFHISWFVVFLYICNTLICTFKCVFVSTYTPLHSVRIHAAHQDCKKEFIYSRQLIIKTEVSYSFITTTVLEQNHRSHHKGAT